MRPIIDANVLMHGRGNYGFDKAYTVPEVVSELESSESRLKADKLDLKVESPSKDARNKVEEKAEEIFAKVSEADRSLAALALDKEKKLITDDKDLQNLASHLDIIFQSFMGEKIEKELKWKKTCGNCGSEVKNPPCPRCGSDQVRRRLDSRS